PGGWSQVAAARVGAQAGRGRVVAIDILDMPPLPGVEFLHLDFLDADAPDRLKAMTAGPVDVVLSDMAANATGHRKTDHLRIMGLAEAAAMFAREVLKPGGAFLAKVLKAEPKARCSPISSVISRRSSTSSHQRAAQIRRSSTFSRLAFVTAPADRF